MPFKGVLSVKGHFAPAGSMVRAQPSLKKRLAGSGECDMRCTSELPLYWIHLELFQMNLKKRKDPNIATYNLHSLSSY